MPVIDMQNVSRHYSMGDEVVNALSNVCLTVEKGDYLAVLGPSGSGKSTLMNIIGCMDKINEGTYLLESEDVNTLSEKRLTTLRGEKIGFVFQKYQLIPRYNVLDNIILPLLARGMTRKIAIEKSLETIELLGLGSRLRHRPKELSGGQQQRVAIARALVGSPSVLLADEPTGALDSATGKEVLALFQRVNELGNTVILITHDKTVAQRAKRTVEINDGMLTG